MKHWIGIIVGIAFLIGVIASIAGCKNASNQTMTSPTTVEFGGVNSTSSKSTSGLSLSLSLDSTIYQPGQPISIVVDEINTLLKTNKVSASEKWPVAGLSVEPCGTLNYPFGVVVYKGNYTSADISSAIPLDLYGPYAGHSCPRLLGSIASYVFQPSNDIADIFQTSETNAAITKMKMNSDVEPIPTGYWVRNYTNIFFTDFDPGVYTVVAGDEWGTMVVRHFTVSK
jgi:hypothetical protein